MQGFMRFGISSFVAAAVILPPATSRAQETPAGIEARLMKIESRLAEIERRMSKLERPRQPIASRSARRPPSPLSVRLVKKEFREADLLAGDTNDRLLFSLVFGNGFEKDVRAFTGVVVFKDLFDQEILRIYVTDAEGVKARQQVQWDGWVNYHDFNESHRRLRNISPEDTSVDFLLEKIVYKDGTRAAYLEDLEGVTGMPLTAQKMSATPKAPPSQEPVTPPAPEGGA